jgi:hypothetical protein
MIPVNRIPYCNSTRHSFMTGAGAGSHFRGLISLVHDRGKPRKALPVFGVGS